MEVKKSHKADLEHLRPWILIGSFLAVTLLFVGVLFIPFQSIGSMLENYFDDYSMDLDLKIDERENMISAAQKESEKKKVEPQKINKVDDVIEMKEEEPEPSADAEPTDEEIEEQQPINQNDDDEGLVGIGLHSTRTSCSVQEIAFIIAQLLAKWKHFDHLAKKKTARMKAGCNGVKHQLMRRWALLTSMGSNCGT